MSIPVVEIEGMQARYRWRRRLHDVSLRIGKGEIVGIVGLAKSGKTALLRSMLGTAPFRSGRVRVFGLDPVYDSAEVLSRVGYVSQARDLIPGLRLQELILCARPFYADWDEAYEKQLMDEFELTPKAEVDTFDFDRRTKTALLMAVAHHPDLFVIDEPFCASCAAAEFLRSLVQSIAAAGRTVVLASRSFREVEHLASHIVMLHQGRVILDMRMDEFRAAFHRCVVRLESLWPAWADLPGLVCAAGTGETWELVFKGDVDAFAQAVTGIEGNVIEIGPATLENVYAGTVLARNRIRACSI